MLQDAIDQLVGWTVMLNEKLKFCLPSESIELGLNIQGMWKIVVLH